MPYSPAAHESEQNNIAAKLDYGSTASMLKALCWNVFCVELEEGALSLRCMSQLEQVQLSLRG